MTRCGIIDVRAKINGKDNVDIEIQIAEQSSILERILFYWAKMYAKQIQRGNDYTVLNRCISVIFLEQKLPHLKELPIHSQWQILEKENGKILLTDRLEIHIIEMVKEAKSSDDKEIKKWLTFLKEPYGREIKKMSEEKEEIKVALEGLEKINADEEKVRMAELREKYILDRNTEIKVAEAKGEMQKAKEIAKKMKTKGVSIDDIIEITELTREEIEKL